MAKNENLHKAKTAKNDEFYTQLSDIEKEMVHYKQHFNGKTVYCNCDDARESNFFKYFSLNFEHLGLKKLITTGFKADGQGVVLIYEGDKNGNRTPDAEEIEIRQLKGNGDFRSEECIEFLKEADIVVTNPPFSLFREYIAQLMEYGKKFIVIGPQNALTYKEIFPLIKSNQIWWGFQCVRWFKTENATPKSKIVDGITLTEGDRSRWWTNIDIDKRNIHLDLYKHYSNEYKHYDNYDAIEVSETADIPMDYDGVMGVPITFLDKYCPNQFEIVDINPHFFSLVEQGMEKPKQLSLKSYGMKDPYARILIRHRK